MIDDDVDISDMIHTTNNIDNNFLTPPPDIKRSCRALSLHLQLSIYCTVNMKYLVLFTLAALYLFIYVGAQNQMMGLQQSALAIIKKGSFIYH